MTRELQAAVGASVSTHFDALRLQECSPATGGAKAHALPAVTVVALLTLHLAGLAALWRYYQQPVALAIPTLLLAIAGPLVFWRRHGVFPVATLAPLFFPYAILLIRVVAIRVLDLPVPYQDEASLPNLTLVFYQVDAAVAVGTAGTILTQIACLTRGATRTRAFVLCALALGSGATLWFAAETLGHRTRGVTASDPYAYVQMAIDFVDNGTPIHAYPLFDDIVNLDLTWYPIAHIGYRFPDLALGSAAATVWPFGGSLWLALCYWIGGEQGLYVATPIVALAALAALALLADECCRGAPVLQRATVAAVSVALLATSWEQVDRSLVPLVDVQAQLFSILAIYLALRAARSPRAVAWGAFSGLALGAAYFVRHTQVLLAVPIVIATRTMRQRDRWWLLTVIGVCSLVVALPDLYYHHLYMGSWLTPESKEMDLFSFSSVLDTAASLKDLVFRANEFGYLVPFLCYGIYRLARRSSTIFWVLASWILTLVLFHLPYEALRLRDLLPEFPAAVLLTSYGMVTLVWDVYESRVVAPRYRNVVAVPLVLALLLPGMRTADTLRLPFEPAIATFGYLSEPQRAAFDQLAALTPPNAVVGSTMNDGAIDLYAHRATFRPGLWTARERANFVDGMARAGRPVYLLEDGEETSVVRRDLAGTYALRAVARLEIPFADGDEEMLGTLWEVGARR